MEARRYTLEAGSKDLIVVLLFAITIISTPMLLGLIARAFWEWFLYGWRMLG